MLELQEIKEQEKIEREDLEAQQQMYDEEHTVVVLNGKEYTISQLERIVKEWGELQIKSGMTYCPLCYTDFADNGLFVCDECGNLWAEEERCYSHEHSGKVCVNCCEECADDSAFDDYVNSQIDEMRGK